MPKLRICLLLLFVVIALSGCGKKDVSYFQDHPDEVDDFILKCKSSGESDPEECEAAKQVRMLISKNQYAEAVDGYKNLELTALYDLSDKCSRKSYPLTPELSECKALIEAKETIRAQLLDTYTPKPSSDLHQIIDVVCGAHNLETNTFETRRRYESQVRGGFHKCSVIDEAVTIVKEREATQRYNQIKQRAAEMHQMPMPEMIQAYKAAGCPEYRVLDKELLFDEIPINGEKQAPSYLRYKEGIYHPVECEAFMRAFSERAEKRKDYYVQNRKEAIDKINSCIRAAAEAKNEKESELGNAAIRDFDAISEAAEKPLLADMDCLSAGAAYRISYWKHYSPFCGRADCQPVMVR
jgi:hypothetical protein